MATSPAQEPPVWLEAGTARGWWRPLALPLGLSLVFHALAAGVYFGFLAHRPSPVPGWLQRLQPPDTQPPQLALTVIVVAGEGQQPAPEPAPTPRPGPPPGATTVPENEPDLPQPPPSPPPPTPPPPPPTAPPLTVAPAEPRPPPKPAAILPPTPPVPPQVRTAAGEIASATSPALVPAPANSSAGAFPAQAKEGGPAGVASRPGQDAQAVPAPPNTTASDPGGLAAAGNFAGARLRQPPNLQRFYPYSARAQSITGATRLTLRVDTEGRVLAATVMSSQPPGVFDQAAVRAARALRFEPARQNGRPVEANFDLAIEWRLQP